MDGDITPIDEEDEPIASHGDIRYRYLVRAHYVSSDVSRTVDFSRWSGHPPPPIPAHLDPQRTCVSVTWVAGDTSEARLHWKETMYRADEVTHYQIVRARGICVYDWIPGRDLNAPGFPTILISSLGPASSNQVEVISTVESGVLH